MDAEALGSVRHLLVGSRVVGERLEMRIAVAETKAGFEGKNPPLVARLEKDQTTAKGVPTH